MRHRVLNTEISTLTYTIPRDMAASPLPGSPPPAPPNAPPGGAGDGGACHPLTATSTSACPAVLVSAVSAGIVDGSCQSFPLPPPAAAPPTPLSLSHALSQQVRGGENCPSLKLVLKWCKFDLQTIPAASCMRMYMQACLTLQGPAAVHRESRGG